MHWFPWIVLAVVCLFFIVWLLEIYNKFTRLTARIENSWSQIDIQLNKRITLLPKLLEITKPYLSEKDNELQKISEQITASANIQTIEEQIQANHFLSLSVKNLLGAAEQVPALKRNKEYTDLVHQLMDVHSRIAISRQFYNDTVARYNKAATRRPDKLAARIFHFTEKSYLEAPPQESA